MSDVFVSYAREDRGLVQRLTDALAARGRDSWVDWERIEPGDRWWQSITEAIDDADTFVFVLSPDSLASGVCARELAHAAGEHKRVIGVVARDVEGLPVPSAVAEVNWIFLRDGDDFASELAQLERALELDLDLVRIHTRVLTRARAWEESGRRPTPLLRGEELRGAERWLERAAAGAQPQPTDVQLAFVRESRSRAARRQRLALIGSIGVTALSVALATFALIQRAQARQQARIAQSRELAARAEAELGTNPEDAIALAARAVRIQSTPQAIHALGHALQSSRLRSELHIASPVEALEFSPDGSSLAIGSDDGAVGLVRVADGRRLWSEGRGELPATGITFARRGDVLAVARHSINGGTGCSVELLDAVTGAVRRRLESVTSTYCDRFVGFLGKTRVVAVGDQAGALRLWNADTGREVGTVGGLQTPAGGVVPAGGGTTFTMGFRADGRAIAAGGNDDVVRVVSVPGGRPLARIGGQNLLKPSSLSFSPNGSGLAIASRNAAVVDTLSYGQVNETADEVEQDVVTGVAWSPNGRLFADASGDVHVWATRSERLVDDLQPGSASGFSAVAFSSRGLLAGGSADGSVRIWAPDPDLPARQIRDVGDSSPYEAGTATHAHLAAVGDISGAVAVTDDDGNLVKWLFPHGDAGSFAVTGDGALAFTRGGKLDLVGLRSGQLISSSPLPFPVATSLAVAADARVIAGLATNGMLAVRSRGAWHTTRVTANHNGMSGSTTVTLSADGRLLGLAGSTSSQVIRILDTAHLRAERVEPGTTAAFSPAGGLIAIQRPDLSIAVVRTSDWHTQTILRGAGPQAELTFSPDGRLVAANSQGTLRTWDVSDGTLLSTRYVIDDIGYSASNLALSPPILTAAGFAVLGDPDTDSVDTFDACVGCLSPHLLLAAAQTRLHEIQPKNIS